MAARGSAKAILRVAGLLLASAALAFPQAADSGLQVRAVQGEAVQAKPQSSVTLVFRVNSPSKTPHVMVPAVELPGGWRSVFEEAPFTMESGEQAIRLVSVVVPVRAEAGHYRIGYSVSASDEPSLAGRAEADVEVLLEARLTVEALDPGRLAVAGERCRPRFLVSNQSNASLDVSLRVNSNAPGAKPDHNALRLAAGESGTVEVAVPTDPRLSSRLSQQIQLTAVSDVPGKGMISAAAITELEVIPRVSGKADYFDRLPGEIGFLAIGAGGAHGYGQVKFQGSGSLDHAGNHRLDFYFRGPGRGLSRDIFFQFGYQPDEYRLSYESPIGNVRAGDGVYSLTRLTENGNYGRGIEAGGALGKFSLRAYVERMLAWNGNGRGNEKAFQFGFRPSAKVALDLSVMDRKDPQRPATSPILSLRSQFSSKNAYGTLEYSRDSTDGMTTGRSKSALWLEGGGTYKKLEARANVIRSGANYHGYYENLDYGSGELAYAHNERWGLRASYLSQKRHAAIEPFIQPFSDRTIQAGAYYQAFRHLSFSLDERVHDRRDLSSDQAFDYRDTTLRLGSFFYVGTLNLQGFVDIGRTDNHQIHGSERLAEYTVAANYLAIGKISFSAYARYRDQDEAFTGDKIRRLDLNVSVGLNLGRITINALYRTSVLHDLYRTALSRQSFEDPAFLLNGYDVFGASVAFRFKNGQSLGFRVQRAVSPIQASGLPAMRTIGLLEYSIPVGFPVTRKRTVGMLRGRVIDSDRGRLGVPGMVVRVNDLATMTDNKGEYVFNSLGPGSYVLTIDDQHADSDKVSAVKLPLKLVVEGGKTVDCQIGMTTGASLRGRVMTYDSGETALQVVKKGPDDRAPSPESPTEAGAGPKPQLIERTPLAGADIELRGEGDVLEQATDAQGRFVFEGLRPGHYVLRVYDDDLPEFHVFEHDTFEFDLKPASKEEIMIRVVPVSRPIQIIDMGEVRIKKK
jgi:hypothetical protein